MGTMGVVFKKYLSNHPEVSNNSRFNSGGARCLIWGQKVRIWDNTRRNLKRAICVSAWNFYAGPLLIAVYQ
ncbi:hypothetical protein VCRA2119O147_330021 [Vibrio crassostreae]|jgi:hypothetical protein|nr:hypothetical protein EDB58_11288 [Vibrio crassostreae]TCL18859.1 hypothetical protein EDB52_11778 [Vibrio crassostreae]TCN05042.1 hypothetical protein EDB35_11935 [Vibrio crassostreae]TCN92656.1 hypothetical protein EDB50_1103 [Vibrio crassostreae]TCN96105.1 hypothetical protein EDB30_11987 [Vibrio crassostreae]